MHSIFDHAVPEIQQGALRLRRVCQNDAAAFFEMMSDDENAHFMTPTLHKTIQDSAANIASIQNQYGNGTGIFFAVTHGKDNRMIGLVGVNKIDEEKASGRISYLINKRLWGRGYGPLATNMLVYFIFERTPIIHLEATIKPDNTKSANCIQMAGFRLERVIVNYVSSAKVDTSKVRLFYVRDKEGDE